MKYILLISLFSLVGCGERLASISSAPNEEIQQPNRAFYTAQLAADQKVDERVRAVTLLTYPSPSDLDKEGFVFERGPQKAKNWERVEKAAPYVTTLLEQFNMLDGQEKVDRLMAMIIDMGRSRNDAYVLMREAKSGQRDLDNEKKKFNESSVTFTCWSKKRFRRGRATECKSAKDVDHSKKKVASCKTIVNMSFDDLAAERQAEFTGTKTWCSSDRADQITDEGLKLGDKYKVQAQIFEDGESIVLNLLEEAQNFAKVGFISTSATKEKETDMADVKSVLKFSDDLKTIEKFELHIDFGAYFDLARTGKKDEAGNPLRLTDKVPYKMLTADEVAELKEGELYSKDLAGLIQNLEVYVNRDATTMVKFEIDTIDFVIEADLAIGVRADFGVRLVGDTIVRYKNSNMQREGVMKIELDTAKKGEEFLDILKAKVVEK